LANESLFAIIMYVCKQLNSNHIISTVTHATDWSRQSSATSPHLFKTADESNIQFIKRAIDTKKFSVFIRKIAPEFPDEILRHFLFEYSKKEDQQLVLKEPMLFVFSRWKAYLYYGLPIILLLYIFKRLLL